MVILHPISYLFTPRKFTPGRCERFAVVMRVTVMVGSVYTTVWAIAMVFLDKMKTSQKGDEESEEPEV